MQETKGVPDSQEFGASLHLQCSFTTFVPHNRHRPDKKPEIMKLRLWRRRVVVLDYAAAITLTVGADTDTVRIKQLTGALALTLADPAPNDGDRFVLLLQSDATGRTTTLTGLAGGTIVLTAGQHQAVAFVYNSQVGKYSYGAASV